MFNILSLLQLYYLGFLLKTPCLIGLFNIQNENWKWAKNRPINNYQIKIIFSQFSFIPHLLFKDIAFWIKRVKKSISIISDIFFHFRFRFSFRLNLAMYFNFNVISNFNRLNFINIYDSFTLFRIPNQSHFIHQL